MRTFKVSITVQVPITKFPLDRIVDDNFAQEILHEAANKLDARGLLATDIVELIVGEKEKVIF